MTLNGSACNLFIRQTQSASPASVAQQIVAELFWYAACCSEWGEGGDLEVGQEDTQLSGLSLQLDKSLSPQSAAEAKLYLSRRHFLHKDEEDLNALRFSFFTEKY